MHTRLSIGQGVARARVFPEDRVRGRHQPSPGGLWLTGPPSLSDCRPAFARGYGAAGYKTTDRPSLSELWRGGPAVARRAMAKHARSHLSGFAAEPGGRLPSASCPRPTENRGRRTALSGAGADRDLRGSRASSLPPRRGRLRAVAPTGEEGAASLRPYGLFFRGGGGVSVRASRPGRRGGLSLWTGGWRGLSTRG